MRTPPRIRTVRMFINTHITLVTGLDLTVTVPAIS
jgi:hypothetical protein